MSDQITVIRTYEPTITVVHIPRQQPTILRFPQQGPAGGGGGGNSVNLEAATNLNATRVIATDSNGKAIFADSSAPSVLSVVGINPNAALIGDTVKVQTFGELSDVSFSWTPGAPLFLTTNGIISETAPSTGFILQIGFAEIATKIFINVGEPSIL